VTGVLERAFNGNLGGYELCQGSLVLPDGKILFVGILDNDLLVTRHLQTCELDLTFGVNGILKLPILNSTDEGYKAVLQPDGKILITGSAHNGVNNDFFVARLNYDGTVDTSFNTNGKRGINFGTEDYGYAIVSQFDGRIILAGRSGNDIGLVRLYGNYDIFGEMFNRPPTLDQPADISGLLEDAPQQQVNLTGISAGGSELQPVSVTAVSNNSSVIPNPAVTYTSGNTTGSLAFTPVANQSGTAVITVTVTDGGPDGDLATTADNKSSNRSFKITVLPVNDQPTLDTITDRTISEDAPQQTVNLSGITAGGGESQTLRVTVASNNLSLIPVPAVTYTSPNSTGSITFTPTADKSGNAVITVTVEDAGLDNDISTTADNATLSRAFTVTVTPINDNPTLDAISDVTVAEDAPQQTINLTGISAGGGESQPLRVTVSSSNPSIIPLPSVSYTTPNTSGSISFTPVADKSGTSIVTVTVTDAGLDGDLATSADNASFSRLFTVTVTPVNDTPTLDSLADLNISEDAPQQTIQLTGITAGGGESQPLRVTATSSNLAVIPAPNVNYTSPNTTGSLTFTPVADKSGISIIKVTVEDGGLDNDLATTADNALFNRSFTVTVGPVNDMPTLDPLNDLTVAEDAAPQTVNLSGISAGGGESQNMKVYATSSNTALIANPVVTYTSPNATGTLAFFPISDKSGSAVITVTVEDAGLDGDLSSTADNGKLNRLFTVTVTPVNDVPTLDSIADVTIAEDAPQQSLNLTGISAGGSESQPLRVTVASSNSALIPTPTVTYNSQNSTGSIAFTPIADKSGTSIITVTVTDGGLDGDLSSTADNATFSRAFTVTVTPVNDTPTLDSLTNLTISEDAPQQNVNLSGVTAGGGESQPLRITAASSNQAIIPTPTTTYTSPNTNGSISFAPTADQFGTCVITVTVEDAGFDGDLSTSSDNATFSRSFTVTITPVNDVPTLDTISDITIAEDAAAQIVNLKGITAGGGESQPLRVTAVSSNLNLIPAPSVSYTTPNTTGSISFTPVADKSGFSIITVTVEDGGLDGNLSTANDNGLFSRSFKVTVSPINDSPTLNALSNLSLPENSPTQNVNLSGITAGGGESQPLRVIVSSSNTLLIPIPTVSYTSPNSTGSLSFTPQTDVVGSSLITVTVEDGGLDEDLSTLADNLTYSRSFQVTIDLVNDPPTLNQIDNVNINEDASQQTVNLSGISAGNNESQPLRIKVQSNNTTLIPTPVTNYKSPDATGSIAFSPVSDKWGIAVITVTVEDGGFDGDLNTAADNASFARSFTVNVAPVNDSPTLDALSDLSIEEDTTARKINLTGITAGGNETQPLRVMAISNNAVLIPNPTINYTTPNSTASLAFLPQPNQSGTAIISVTVEDGGLDNDLATSIDNSLFTRSFTVTVISINDPPTLDPLGGLGTTQRFDSIRQPESFDSGDIDRDGDIDVIVFNRSSGAKIDVYRNDGKGNFTQTERFSAIPGEPDSLGINLHDFDRDGDLDLLLRFNGDGGQFKVLTNNGSGIFSYTSTVVSMGSITPLGLYPYDFNNDGLIDFASPNLNGNSFSVVLRQNINTFRSPTVYTLTEAAASNPSKLYLDDIDRDGITDTLIPTAAGGNLVIYLGNADGSFGRKVILNGGFQTCASAYIDVDRDGDFDVVQTENQNKIHLWRNNGFGTFTFEPNWLVIPNTNFLGLFPGNIAGNADPELIVATSTDLRFVSDLNGSKATSTINQNRYEYVITGDWNLDGLPDVAAISSPDNKFDIVNSQLSRFTIANSGGELRVPLTGITAGPNENQSLRVTATSDVPQLFSEISTTLNIVTQSGEVFLKAAPDTKGSAVITVKVEDGGLDNNLDTPSDNAYSTRKFLVDVLNANFQENGTTLKLRVTDPNQQLSIKATATGYEFALSSGQWRGIDNSRVSGNGTNKLLVSLNGKAAYDSIEIDDDAGNTWVYFQDSGSNNYTESLVIRLDRIDAGNISFNGRTSFLGTASFSASTTRGIEIVGTTSKLSTTDGNLLLSANRQSQPHPDSFVGIEVREATVEVVGNGNLTLEGSAGGSSADSSYWFGIAIHQGAQVLGGPNQSKIVLNGLGGFGAGNDNSGVAINGFGITGNPTRVQSRGADIDIFGQGRAAEGSLWSRGVRIRDGAQVAIVRDPEFGSSQAGKINIRGIGATSRGDHFGVDLSGSGTRVYSAGGPVSITGIGSGPTFYHGNKGIVIQDGATIGSQTISQAITLTGSSDDITYGLHMSHGSSSILAGPSGTVSIESNTPVYFENSTSDVETQTLRFSPSTPLYFKIDGTAPETQFTQWDIKGTIDLTGSQLRFAGSHLFRNGSPIVLIDNDGSDAITGTFQGLPEGSILYLNQVALRISYQGGSGNDVSLTPINLQPTMDQLQDIVVTEDSTVRSVNLSGILAGGNEKQPLKITATSSVASLIPSPTVNYSSPNTNGSISFTPIADKSGTSVITVTVEDGGLDADLSTLADNAILNRTFTVTVTPINDVPTLNQLSDISILEDASTRIVNLSGISAGGGELQNIRVSASSSDNLLIPNPVVTYASPNSSGSLAITPIADKNGVAVITVTVEDAGLDGDLSSTTDNGQVSRSFIVTVNPVNDTPTIDTISDLAISEDSLAQTVSLSGISAGGGEVQNIRISATSSNPSLIPNPIVTYTSPNATGSLALTPIPNQSGSAVITVTVEDAGLDGDLSSTADNGKLNRSFTVVVNPVNDTPSFDSVTDLTLSEDAPQQAIAITAITAGALEAQPMSLTAVSSAPWLTGSLFIDYTSPNSTGAVRFTPQPNQHGTAKLTVVLTDGGLDNNLTTTADNASVSRIIDVNILSVNDSPSAINTAREINANSQLIYSIAELLELAQDADLPLDTLNPIAATYKTSLNASVEISASQGLLYDPTNLIQVKQLRTGEKLIDQATYRFRDNDGATSNLGTVQITLNGVNDPPVVVSDQFELPINRPTLLDILRNDFDYDNNLNPSSIEIISTPVGGTLHIINGQVEYRPNKTILGTDTFSYRVRDSEGSVSDVTTVALTLNEYPETVIDSKTTKRDQSLEIDVLANDFSYLSPLVPSTIQIVSSSPHGATTPTNGKVQFIPSQGFLGEASFTYTVQNTLGITSAPTSVKIVVDGSKYQNSGNRFDVNSDSNVNAIDALVIINNLNRFGVREVGSIQNEPFFLDVDGNYFVNAIDALQVINYLNSLNQGEGSEGEFDSDSFAVDRSNDSETTAEIDTFAGLLALLAEDHQRKNRTKNMLQR
jgi:uncharacterized delta-60 repeat protein